MNNSTVDPDRTTASSPRRRGSNRTVATGQRFGRWLVIDPDVRVGHNRRGALVRCSCIGGTERTVSLGDLFSGNSKSCGCIRSEMVSRRNREANPAITHGMTGHQLFYTWSAMLARCEKSADKDWPRYGGRGIRVCDRWHDVRAFVADIESSIGLRPAGAYPNGRPLYTLDRINNNGNYEPGNVQWSTVLTQNRNRRQRPWPRCTCGNRNPARAKFCFECGTALPLLTSAAGNPAT
jgi:hypothetical protein